MFTGIIKELGVVRDLARTGKLYTIEIASKTVCETAEMGDSVSVNGVCLTVTEKRRGILSFDVTGETVNRSSLGILKKDDKVNLEGSLRANDALGGHFVLGHIDCAGRIKSVKVRGDDPFIEIEFPEEFLPLVVEKGSITIDGVSLTIGKISGNSLKVYLIPHTLRTTTLGFKKAKDMVNVEFDILGKYILRFKEQKTARALTEEFLKEHGF